MNTSAHLPANPDSAQEAKENLLVWALVHTVHRVCVEHCTVDRWVVFFDKVVTELTAHWSREIMRAEESSGRKVKKSS